MSSVSNLAYSLLALFLISSAPEAQAGPFHPIEDTEAPDEAGMSGTESFEDMSAHESNDSTIWPKIAMIVNGNQLPELAASTELKTFFNSMPVFPENLLAVNYPGLKKSYILDNSLKLLAPPRQRKLRN